MLVLDINLLTAGVMIGGPSCRSYVKDPSDPQVKWMWVDMRKGRVEKYVACKSIGRKRKP